MIYRDPVKPWMYRRVWPAGQADATSGAETRRPSQRVMTADSGLTASTPNMDGFAMARSTLRYALATALLTTFDPSGCGGGSSNVTG